jgi:hypothetical protein
MSRDEIDPASAFAVSLDFVRISAKGSRREANSIDGAAGHDYLGGHDSGSKHRMAGAR